MGAGGVTGGSSYQALAPEQVLDLLQTILRNHNSTQITKGYVLVALTKLAPRFGQPHADRISRIVEGFQESMSLELQARSCEFSQLLAPNLASLQSQMLEKMPVLDEEAMRERRARFNEEGSGSETMGSPVGGGGSGNRWRQKPSKVGNADAGVRSDPTASLEGPNLLDLNDLLDAGNGSSQPSGINGGSSAPAAASVDLLADIFSGSTSLSDAPPPPPPSSNPSFVAMDNAGMRVTFELSKPEPLDPSVTQVVAHFENHSGQEITGLHFQAAVPKYLSMVLQPASGASISPGGAGTVEQVLRLTNSMQGQKSIMLKMKLDFDVGGRKMQELVAVSGFPELY
jgi:AP-1 complex subunit gamma-1